MFDISPLKSLTEHKFFNLIAEKALKEPLPQIQSQYLCILLCLNSTKISKYALQQLSMKGVLDEDNNLRSITWKVLLGYIGLNTEKWEDELDTKRMEYDEIKKKYTQPITIANEQKKKKKTFDHPLSTTSTSIWNQHFKDNTIINDINKDLKRTRNEMDFFNSMSSKNKKESNLEILKRILFIYAKQHPEVNYVHGLNEILAPIFYSFANDDNPYFALGAEADSYFCFELLLNEIQNIYIKSLDQTEKGIDTVLFNFSKLVKYVDNEIYSRLAELKIDYHFFAFQWFTLMFTQQFMMPDVLRLWDTILSSDDKFKVVSELSVSILKCKKNDIVFGDFSKCMDTLQNFEDMKVEKILETRNNLQSVFETYYKGMKYNGNTYVLI